MLYVYLSTSYFLLGKCEERSQAAPLQKVHAYLIRDVYEAVITCC